MNRIRFLRGLILCICITALFIPSMAWGAIPAAERNALIALYNSTGGAGWTDSTNWLGAAGTECTWHGISCVGGNTVASINLSSNNLTGTIPPELGSLTNLTILYLSSNNLSGAIPAELGNLSSLTRLDLISNSLTGTIPLELTNLSGLTYLALSINNLTGNIPPGFGNLSNLTTLRLSSNNFTGSIPPELGNLTNLTSLDLRNNSLTGTIPRELGSLFNLTQLYLSSNSLSGTIPSELGNLSNLTSLYLYSNNLTGNIPPELGNLTNLIYLFIDRNGLTGSIPVGVSNFPLASCNIDYNGLYSTDPLLTTHLDTYCGSWQATQTVAPDNLATGAITNTSVALSWTTIVYTTGTGGYEVHYSTVSGGPYAYFGTTANKAVVNMTVTGLMPGTTYYFVVRTRTDPHANNTNTVLSDFSSEISATTTGTSPLAATDSVAPVNDYMVPFGSINIAGASRTETVQIEYLGGAGFGFNLDSVTVSGTNAGEFSVDLGNGSGTTCGPMPVNFSSPVSCTVDVTFDPASPGAKSAFVDFAFSSDSVPTVRVALSGTGVAPAISVSPLSLDLGDVADGTTSAPMTVTVSNIGNSTLTVGNAVLSGTNPGEFAIASGGTCGSVPFNVSAGSSCTMNITLSPSGTGGKSAILIITSNDPLNPQVTVTLSGSATSPRINVTPGSIDFGNVTEGMTSVPRTVSITNTGSHVLTVSGMVLNGMNAGEFRLDPGNGTAGTCGTATPSVPISGSCSVRVTFSPASTGAKTASLDITSDDPVDSTVSVSLSGTGVSSSVNNPPNAPSLVSPEDGATGISVPVTFQWNAATDPDGDAVTYDLYLCQDASFVTCPTPENIDPITASAFRKTVTFAGMTFGIGFIGIAFAGGLSRRRRLALMLAFLILISVGLLSGCSSGSSNKPAVSVTYQVLTLDPGATYYWKVVATDGTASTESQIRSFTTK